MTFFSPYFLHGLSCALTLVLPAIGVSIGQGLTGVAAIKALNLQPSARGDISRICMIALVFMETAVILALIISLRLISTQPVTTEVALFAHASELGIFFAIGLTGCVVGIASSFPAQEACLAVARQPFFTNKIQLLMLITQSLIQTPVVIGFIISLLLYGQLATITDAANMLRAIGSGLCIGLGSVGPAIGLALLARQSCKSAGMNRALFTKIFSFTAISFALIESTIVFCFIIAYLLLTPITKGTTFYEGLPALCAAITMALGTLGVGISSGMISATSCRVFTEKAEQYDVVSKTSFFSQIFTESCAIYALIIALRLVSL